MMVSVSLIALGTGYIVYVAASKEKEGMKMLGQVIGVVVMVAAVLSAVCGAARCASKSGACPMMAKMSRPLSVDPAAKQ